MSVIVSSSKEQGDNYDFYHNGLSSAAFCIYIYVDNFRLNSGDCYRCGTES